MARKQGTYREVHESTTANLVILAAEVYGRCSPDVPRLLRGLAFHKANSAPLALRRSVALAWHSRWWSMISVALAWGVAGCVTLDTDGYEFRPLRASRPPLEEVTPLADFV